MSKKEKQAMKMVNIIAYRYPIADGGRASKILIVLLECYTVSSPIWSSQCFSEFPGT